MRRSYASGVLFGLFIIAFGVLLLGSNLLGWQLGFFANTWWAIVILAVALLNIVHFGPRFWNVLFLLIAAWILLKRLGFLGRYTTVSLFGLILLALGVWVIVRTFAGGSVGMSYGNRGQDSNSFPEYNCIFSDFSIKNVSKAFHGGRIASVFGKMRVDLSEIQIDGNVMVDASAVFGTLEIVVPRNIPYRTKITPVFGSFINDAPPFVYNAGGNGIEIKGAAVFGSIRFL